MGGPGSGKKPRDYPPEVVERIRHLYARLCVSCHRRYDLARVRPAVPPCRKEVVPMPETLRIGSLFTPEQGGACDDGYCWT